MKMVLIMILAGGIILHKSSVKIQFFGLYQYTQLGVSQMGMVLGGNINNKWQFE